MELSEDAASMLKRWGVYRSARIDLLNSIGIPQSCRDPLSEFAEVLVAELLDGTMATNRVQKGWDLESSIGRVQVKYLSNSSTGPWVNWHTVVMNDDIDWYALVIFLGFSPVAVYMFPKVDLTEICEVLKKRHSNQANTLQFTSTNHVAISADPVRFEEMGMKVCLLK